MKDERRQSPVWELSGAKIDPVPTFDHGGPQATDQMDANDPKATVLIRAKTPARHGSPCNVDNSRIETRGSGGRWQPATLPWGSTVQCPTPASNQGSRAMPPRAQLGCWRGRVAVVEPKRCVPPHAAFVGGCGGVRFVVPASWSCVASLSTLDRRTRETRWSKPDRSKIVRLKQKKRKEENKAPRSRVKWCRPSTKEYLARVALDHFPPLAFEGPPPRHSRFGARFG